MCENDANSAYKSIFQIIDKSELIVGPNSMNFLAVFFVENSLSVKFIAFEIALVTLSILEVLDAKAIEHSAQPVTIILFNFSLSKENAISSLCSLNKLSLVSTAISPPESTSSMSPSLRKLTFIHIRLFSIPSVDTPPFFQVLSKLTYVVIPIQKIQLSIALNFSFMKISVNNFISFLKKTYAISMWQSISFLSYVCNGRILNKSGVEKFRFLIKYNRCGSFNNQQLLQIRFQTLQLFLNK